ncbi:MAG: hypothetical protein JRF33_06230 [Deltaproteobacteria bacterium]|nr:hypothetical protein [Deltaproteobacteria bacterium]
MDLCPAFIDPVNRYESKLDRDLYRTSTKQFEDGQYETSFRTFMNYVNREMAEGCEIEPKRWQLPHGSLVVDMSIKDDLFEIKVPFIKLPADRLAPILRRSLDINTNVLTLSQIKLSDDGLYFHYSCPMALAEPFKIYGIIREICINGDSYDDEFIEEFGAEALREKQVTYLPEDVLEKAWNQFHQILDEAMGYDEYFVAKRWNGLCVDILGYALMKIDYSLAPQGYLRSKLEKSISWLWSRSPTEEVLANLRQDFKEFKSIEKEKFFKDFYRTTFFIHAKMSSEIEGCQKALAGRYDWAGQDKARSNHLGLTVNYIYGAYDLFYKFFVPTKLEEELQRTMEACSNKTWKEASELCWTSFQKIMDPAFAS